MNEIIIPDDTNINTNRFLMLCDNVQNCFALIDNSMFELLEMKDQLLLQSLPAKVLLRITLVLSRFYRAYSQTQIPVYELIDLVQLHNDLFNQRCRLFKRLYDSDEMKKRMLDVALQRITAGEKHVEEHREKKIIDNWEKLYLHLALPRSSVRKWKFRLETFHEKATLGYEHVIDWLHTAASRAVSPSPELSDDEESIGEQNIDQEDDSDDNASSVPEIEEPNQPIDYSPEQDQIDHHNDETAPHQSARSSKYEHVQSASPIVMVDSEVQAQPDFDDQQTSTDDKFSTKLVLMRIYRPIEIMRTTFQCIVHSQGQSYPTKEWKFNKTNKSISNATKENIEIDRQQYDELVVPVSNLKQRDVDINSIRIDVLGDRKLFGCVVFSYEDLQILDLPVLNNQIFSPFIAMDNNNNIPRKNIRLDLDQPSNEVYQACLSIPPRTFSIYDDQHESVAELPLLMFWYDKIENTQATKSTMTTSMEENPISQISVMKQSKSIDNDRIKAMTTTYENKIIQIHDEYQAEIQRLTELLHEKLSRQSSRMIDGANSSENILETHHAGVSNIYIRRQRPKSESKNKHRQQRYSSERNSSDSFLDRNEIYLQQRSMHRNQLMTKVSRQTSLINERQMEIQHRLYKSQSNNAYDDLCLPGVFMPSQSNHVYNPRAYQYFHSIGTREPRLTQPPSIFKLPAVPSGSISMLSLFELTRCHKTDEENEPTDE
ncbi:unnamed protein product [Adineta ricciae]|uniref:Uncharacterized protein n=1 Tax=Adineta ricciae TaxID=249248 RepID=A0A815RL19_ADIRI|nr:unnamed protein product [Adineta ricciae]CAF1478962.1 unnamed protein product [Adineta ricciae]